MMLIASKLIGGEYDTKNQHMKHINHLLFCGAIGNFLGTNIYTNVFFKGLHILYRFQIELLNFRS